MDGNDLPQADKISGAEVVKDLLGSGSVLGAVLKALPDQLLHVWPRGTAIVLNVRDTVTLYRRRQKGETGSERRNTHTRARTRTGTRTHTHTHAHTHTHTHTV